jgi:hypothetical protein
MTKTVDHGSRKPSSPAWAITDDVGDVSRPKLGDRFQLTRNATVHAWYTVYAPLHTTGGEAELPAGTVVIATEPNPDPDTSAFFAYPEDYDELETTVVPESTRQADWYAGGYVLIFRFNEIDDLLQPIEPLDPRPATSWAPTLKRLADD